MHQQKKGEIGMKKVIIFTSGAAGGQTSITNALTESLSQDYTVSTISFFYQLLAPLDIAHRNNAEGMYNWIAFKKWNWFTNRIFFNAAIYYYRLRRKKILSLIREYLIQEQPIAVISVIPFVNSEIFQITQELNIPFLIFSADLDPATYLTHIKNTSSHNFYLGLPFFDETFNPLLAKHQIPQKQVIVTGYPMRSDFTEPKNKPLLREKFSIPKNKPVILVLLGSQGTQTLPTLINKIYQIASPAHMLICTGKAEHLAKKIKKIPLPSHLSMQIIGYTNQIADLMAASDLFVTKSGSVSVSEALYMNLPMLLDATSEVLVWEQFNHDFIQKNHLGSSAASLEEIVLEIDALLLDKRNLALIRNNIRLFEKKQGNKAVKQIIDQMTVKTRAKTPLLFTHKS